MSTATAGHQEVDVRAPRAAHSPADLRPSTMCRRAANRESARRVRLRRQEMLCATQVGKGFLREVGRLCREGSSGRTGCLSAPTLPLVAVGQAGRHHTAWYLVCTQ